MTQADRSTPTPSSSDSSVTFGEQDDISTTETISFEGDASDFSSELSNYGSTEKLKESTSAPNLGNSPKSVGDFFADTKPSSKGLKFELPTLSFSELGGGQNLGAEEWDFFADVDFDKECSESVNKTHSPAPPRLPTLNEEQPPKDGLSSNVFTSQIARKRSNLEDIITRTNPKHAKTNSFSKF